MKKQIALVVLCLLVIVSGIFLAIKNHSSSSSVIDSKTKFSVAPNNKTSFRATITVEKDSQKYTSQLEWDAQKEAAKYLDGSKNNQYLTLYTRDNYYMCQGDGLNCYKYPLGSGPGTNFNPNNYKFDSQKISTLKSNAQYLSKQNCSVGKCKMWQIKNSIQNLVLWIDAKTFRIVQTTNQTKDTKITAVYDYADVNVKIPSDAQTIPTIRGLGQ